ncbi:MAG: phosphotransferase [Dehalococcoidia bacterium]
MSLPPRNWRRTPSGAGWIDSQPVPCKSPRRHPPLEPGLVAHLDMLIAAYLELAASGWLPALVHNDLGPVHVIGRSDQVAGLIDWSDMTIGDPAVDFAGILARSGQSAFRAVEKAYAALVDRHSPVACVTTPALPPPRCPPRHCWPATPQSSVMASKDLLAGRHYWTEMPEGAGFRFWPPGGLDSSRRGGHDMNNVGALRRRSMSRRPAVSHGLIWPLQSRSESLGSSFQVAASSPSADWHSHAFYTDTPLVRSYTSWNIYTPMYQWGYNTIVDPSVTSGSAPVNLINYYGQDVYHYACSSWARWRHRLRRAIFWGYR